MKFFDQTQSGADIKNNHLQRQDLRRGTWTEPSDRKVIPVDFDLKVDICLLINHW